MQKFNCFYRLINKQITSNHNFGLSKGRKMDQEAEIFKCRGTQNSPNINEVSVQVKYKNKRYRSRYDIHVNLCQQNIRQRRSRAVSRIPTTQIKRVLQKSKNVVIKVQKYVRKVVPQSSKLHVFLCKKSSAYHRLNNKFCGICDHQHKSARKPRSNLDNKISITQLVD